jgi:hypothetical protein
MLTGRPGDPGRVGRIGRSPVPTHATRRVRSQQESYTAKLAKFFPEASPVRIPVRLTRAGSKGQDASESTIIEFGTPREVLFASSLPLEFADMLHLENSDGTLDAEVSVVALQYMPGRTAVAARFTRELANWIVKS